MNEKFKTNVEVVVDHHSMGEYPLEWSFDMDLREWGVKDVSISVPDQKITIQKSIENSDGDEIGTEDQEIQVENAKIEIGGDLSMEVTFSWYPTQIDIDSKRKTATVEFKVS